MKPEDDPSFVKRDECPACLRMVDCATVVGSQSRPKAGDFAVCAYCQAINRFDDQLNLVTTTDDELEELEPAQLQLLRLAQNAFRMADLAKSLDRAFVPRRR